MSEVSALVRRRVYERDGGCVVQSPTCVGGLTLQHRKNRGMGGSALLDGFENLVTMCAGHNGALEADAPFAGVGRRLGWKLDEGEDAFTVAVFSPLWGGWRLLHGDGGWSLASARDLVERARLDDDRYAEWRNL